MCFHCPSKGVQPSSIRQEELKILFTGDFEKEKDEAVGRQQQERGTLEVLRRGIKDWGCKFRLAYFKPASSLNLELQKLHAANIFSVVR